MQKHVCKKSGRARVCRTKAVCEGDAFITLLLVVPAQRQPMFIVRILGKNNLAVHQPRNEIEIGFHLEMGFHERPLIPAVTFARAVDGLSGCFQIVDIAGHLDGSQPGSQVKLLGCHPVFIIIDLEQKIDQAVDDQQRKRHHWRVSPTDFSGYGNNKHDRYSRRSRIKSPSAATP